VEKGPIKRRPAWSLSGQQKNLSGLGGLKRQVLCSFLLVTQNIFFFIFKKAADGLIKFRMGNPVIGPGQFRFKAALNFMFTLSAGIKTLQAFLNTVFAALVIAGFKM